VLNHPDIHMTLAHARLDELIAEAANEQLVSEARHAAQNFIPKSHWRDGALWASLIGPLVGVGFLAYFALRVARVAVA
jgi:hypothetical protein